MLHQALALSLLVLPFAPQDKKVETVKEPETKKEFPVTRTAEDGKTTVHLTGTAVRDKRVVLLFDVYAYGLYIDGAAAKKALSKWKDKTAKQLEGDSAFYQELCKDNFAKTIRMVFARKVDGDDVEEAFTESIEPRIESAKTKRKMPDASKELQRFKGWFQHETFREGDEVLLTWLPGNELVVVVKGKRKPKLTSPALCWALYDIFLGDDPIETKGKKTVISRTPALLK